MPLFWTPEEDAILKAIIARDLSPQYRTAAYRAELPGRTPAAINNRARYLGIKVRKHRPHRAWTAAENAKLRAEWPTKKPVSHIAAELNRSESSCLNRAKKLGMRTRQPWARVTITPELDAAIRAGYASTQRGICQRIADRFGVSPGWVKVRARELGLTRVNGSSGRWSEKEDALLETLMERGGIKYIQTRMKKAGYNRSLAAIHHRAYAIGLSWVGNRDIMNATDLASAMGVDFKCITRWINRGILKAKKDTLCGLTDNETASRWVIENKDIKAFLIDFVGSYKLANVNAQWYLSMVAGDAARINIQHSAGTNNNLSGGYSEYEVCA
jgi:hypothetical protein